MDIPIGLNLPDQVVSEPLDQKLHNVIVTDSGVKKRPGYTLGVDTGSGAKIDGMHYMTEAGVVIVVTGGEVHKMSQPAPPAASFLLLEDGSYFLLENGSKLLLESASQITDVSGSNAMEIGTRVSFAQYSDNILYMANGGKIQELFSEASQVSYDPGGGSHNYTCIKNHTAATGSIDPTNATYWTDDGAGSSHTAWANGTRYGSGNAEQLEDGDAPTNVTFIGIADTYLLALEDDSDVIWFSDVAEPWTWTGDFFSATAYTDFGNVLRVQNGKVWVGGRESIQIFENDGSTPWVVSNYADAKFDGDKGAVAHGVHAPHSFIWCDIPAVWVWLDKHDRLVALTGRTAESISPSLDTWLKDVPYTQDAIGDYFVSDGVPFYHLQFPTSNMSILVNLRNYTWCQTESNEGNEGRWTAGCFVYMADWDMFLVGHISDGTVNILNSRYNKDGSYDITSYIRSPRIHTERVNRVPELILYLTKVADATSAADASMTIKHRSDGNDWTTEETISLPDYNEITTATKHLYRFGHYRFYRQYQFTVTDMWPYALKRVVQKDTNPKEEST